VIFTKLMYCSIQES